MGHLFAWPEMPREGHLPERACPCSQGLENVDLGVPHSNGRSVSSSSQSPPPHRPQPVAPAALPGTLSPTLHATRLRRRRGVNALLSGQLRGHPPGAGRWAGQRGRGHMLLKAVDARLFGGLGLASGVTLLRLMSWLGPFFAS